MPRFYRYGSASALRLMAYSTCLPLSCSTLNNYESASLLSISVYVFVPHSSSTMYCLALFILAVLSVIFTKTQADDSTCQPGYKDTLCTCNVINQPNAMQIARWYEAGSSSALEDFNTVWLNPPPELQNLPYVRALSAYWNGPESNVYRLLFCRPLVINELQIGIVT
jgi:hypothetical protein